MKTTLIKIPNIIRSLGRAPKLMILAVVAGALALPQVDARPDRDGRRGGHDRGHGHSSHSRHHHHRHHHRPAYRPPVHRHHHHHAQRGWSRPGFYGAYPPIGYVNYNYRHSLPPGYRVVYRGGHRYYHCDGAYYWPASYRDRNVFIQVRF